MNALFIAYVPIEPEWQALGMLTAWIASLAAGAAFYRWWRCLLRRVMGSVVAHLGGDRRWCRVKDCFPIFREKGLKDTVAVYA